MTEKQKRFVDEYLIDCNATRAYMAAYPNVKKESSAASCAAKLLRNAKVKAYIEKQLEEIRTEKVADAQEVMEYLTAVMRGESKSEIVVVEGEGDGCSSAKRIEKLPDEKEKLKAAELLGKRYGLYTDKIETDIDTELKITIDYGDENEPENTS